MHHLAKLTFGKVAQLPYHAECSCSTAGDFASHQEAREYLAMHLSRIQGVNSADFVDATVTSLPIPVQEPEKVPEQDQPVQTQAKPPEEVSIPKKQAEDSVIEVDAPEANSEETAEAAGE